LRIPADAHTLAGFRAWVKSDEVPEKLPVTFLRGEVYLDLTPEELQTHNAVRGELYRVLMTLNHDHQGGEFYGAGVLMSNEPAQLAHNPDGIFLSWEALDSGRVWLSPCEGHPGQYDEIEGTPDWVLEVVSDCSLARDTQQLRRAYHEAGVPEYWLIDARGKDICFQILHRRKKDYATARNCEGWQRSRVFDRSFRLERRRDQLGLWEYTLHVQPA
jgi:Uma2 family endonuclease